MSLMAKRPTVPPRPDLIRQPTGRFGWLEDRLLHDDWLARLGSEGTSVMVLLALASDRHGASFFSRERMAAKLGISRQDVDQALARMLKWNLVAHRPWRPGHPDGVWQLLPVPPVEKRKRGGDTIRIGQALSIADLCQSLGIDPPGPNTHPQKAPTPPESRAS
jgi:hypothetical protein